MTQDIPEKKPFYKNERMKLYVLIAGIFIVAGVIIPHIIDENTNPIPAKPVGKRPIQFFESNQTTPIFSTSNQTQSQVKFQKKLYYAPLHVRSKSTSEDKGKRTS